MSPWSAAESRQTYHSRIDRAVAYINANLSEDIDLEHVAREVAFSPFHFHRIFTAMLGETPKGFIDRVRLEKAANILLKNPAMTVTEIAGACGFSSSATFARAFKQHFGVSASGYRNTGINQFQETLGLTGSPGECLDYERAGQMVKNVQVKRMPALQIAYISNLEGYSLEKICAAWDRLFRWATARGWITPQTKVLGISFDDPIVTPEDKCRYYACITVPERPAPTDPAGWMELPEGRYAACRATCLPQDFSLIYHALYGIWLPDSGFQPADRPTYEIYHQTPETHPEQKFDLEVCLPLI